MELHESEKPQPLRIIKRSQTIAGGKAGGRSNAGRRWSGCSYESKGSPPLAADGPLTVHKIRNGRGSILDGGLEVKIVDVEKSTAGDGRGHSREDVEDITPKAVRPPPRTLSAGKFLRTELHRGSSENDIKKHMTTRPRQTYKSEETHSALPLPLRQNPDGSPKIPTRRPSKSKNFILKAFGARRTDDSKASLRRNDSNRSALSQNTLLRRLSHRKSTASTYASTVSSIPSSVSTTDYAHSLDRNSRDIIDVGINSRASYYDDDPLSCPPTPTPYSSREETFVLCPQISITPETVSVTANMCMLWAAIEITGVLRRADGTGSAKDMTRNYSSQSLSQCMDLRSYGSLHNIAVELQPGLDCIVVDQPSDLFQAKTIRVSETHLMLVKIRLNKIKLPKLHAKETSSEELMDDLKDILGDLNTEYLTVKLNYRHSAFLNLRAPSGKGDLRFLPQHTLLETKAIATVKRHNPSSAWSPRNSGAMNSPVGINPLTKIIEKHYSAERAREALCKLSDDRIQIPYPRRTYGRNSDKENWKSGASTPTNPTLHGHLAHSFSMTAISPPTSRGSPVSRLVGSPYDHPLDPSDLDEMDPARKIWSQMRRSSKPNRSGRHPRTSISDGHYYSPDEDPEFESPPPSGRQSSYGGLDLFSFHQPQDEIPRASTAAVDDRRNKVMELALRNKRSMGQETLRSMVPSQHSGKGRGVVGATAGLGLVGRNWGQWLPWG